MQGTEYVHFVHNLHASDISHANQGLHTCLLLFLFLFFT